MSIQNIRLFGDPVLRTPAEPVVDFDKELRQLVRDLREMSDSLNAVAQRLNTQGAGGIIGGSKLPDYKPRKR